MKKLVAIAGAGALLLSVVTPAFAKVDFRKPEPIPQTYLTNTAVVENTASAVSTTGNNGQVGGGFMYTGNAGSESTAVVIANTTVVKGCNCLPNIISNGASISNDSSALSSTGANGQTAPAPKIEKHGRHDKSVDPVLTLYTGDAGSSVNAWSVVNTTVSF